MEKIRGDGELKLNDVETLSKTIISKSSSSGQEIILREVDRCKSDWSSLLSAISQVDVAAVFVYSVRILCLGKDGDIISDVICIWPTNICRP